MGTEGGMAIGVEVLADDREELNSSFLDGFKGTKTPLFTLPRLRGSSSNSCLGMMLSMPEGYRKMNQTAKSPGLRDPKAFTDDFRNRGHEQSRKLWEDSIFKCNGSFQSFFSISFPM